MKKYAIGVAVVAILSLMAFSWFSTLACVPGVDKEKAIQFLRSCQNPDGGLGLRPGQPSHTLPTYWSVHGLSRLRSTPPDVTACIAWINSCQNPDGAFGELPGEPSRVLFTFFCIHATILLGYEIPNEEALISWLQACQNPDGGYGQAPGMESAMGCCSSHPPLLGYEPLNKTGAIHWVQSCQNPDGGFGIKPDKPSHMIWTMVAVCHLIWDLNSTVPNPAACEDWVHSCQNSDGGFGPQLGSTSNANSTGWAVRALDALGSKPIHVRACVDWLRSCHNADGGFAPVPGGISDSASTAYAVRALATVGLLVGGIGVPVDKLGLLAPYIGVAGAVVAVTVGAVYAKKRWLGKAVLPKP